MHCFQLVTYTIDDMLFFPEFLSPMVIEKFIFNYALMQHHLFLNMGVT